MDCMKVIPFESAAARALRLDADRRTLCVQRIRTRYKSWEDGHVTLEHLCAEAREAMETYVLDTLDSVFGPLAIAPGEQPPAALVEQFHQSVAQAAHSVRDVIADSQARHAVAQILQTSVLHAESYLRHMAEGRLPLRRRG
jgi:hypothetical protein